MKLKGKKSFGLIEVLIACSILIIVAGAVMAINVIINNNLQFTRERAFAYYRAAEAIEGVRNVRDSNYIDGNADTDWNTYVCNKTKDTTEVPILNNPDIRYRIITDCSVSGANGRFFLAKAEEADEESSVFGISYRYYLTFKDSSINPEITGGQSADNSIRATATVEWNSRGRLHTIQLSELLTNWRQAL